MQSVAMNMMAFKNKSKVPQNQYPNMEDEAIIGGLNANKSYSVSNRAFGKDITNKVLNQTGSVGNHNSSEMDRYRSSIDKNSKVRKPSPGVHSNYQQPTKERNIHP